tara:strand:- start:1940 stop:3688 length:1749 start_codon:yes stop_codon:yes gene_type:complete
MSWKKFFTPVPTGNNASGSYSPFSQRGSSGPGPASTNYSSHLPDVYVGSPNRIERYNQYNTMDSDSEVNAALDILAEFCTQKGKDNDTHFNINFKKQANNSEVQILGQYLKQWCKLNQFDVRMFRTIRNAFKYGDQFFIRDPETQKLFHVDPSQVTKIIVNESDGKKPEQYCVKNLNFAFDALEATPLNQTNSYGPGGTSGYQTVSQQQATGTATPPAGTSRWQTDQGETYIDANHMVHLSMSEGLDQNYPFGNSLLESIFKVYKQKELLEDAIIIYRVQRAPERRVFYVDVGNMPSHLAIQFVERVKTEIHQRRIPSKTGGGTNVIDSSYNPLSINEDYFFPQTAEGRGSKVETLPGGTNLGEIDDLRYFTNKLVRGLRIPSSYLPTGADDGASQYNDGRVGTAYIQELRFNKYCERLQGMLEEVFNVEFKLYLKKKGVNVDYAMFDLAMTPPQNFAAYRQAELDNNRIGTFGSIQAIPFISNRFALKRFLGMTDEEIAENERLWREENEDVMQTGVTDGGAAMGGAPALTGTGLAGDLGGLEDTLPDEGGDIGGGEAPPPETVTGDDLGGAPAPEPDAPA